ncbi:MAG: hypothetical protein F6K24_19315 [Okeania sp. SIO2D1]|nr:hypothetical protein [Okeania sp. SIO2D1]
MTDGNLRAIASYFYTNKIKTKICHSLRLVGWVKRQRNPTTSSTLTGNLTGT